MYSIQLTFDVQNLKIFIKNHHKSYTKKVRQLWNQPPYRKKIMTFENAIWITNNLHILNKQDIYYLIGCIYHCVSIEKKVIKGWIKYKTNEDLEDFAQYEALELIIDGSNNPDLNRYYSYS
jgi:hypothetical protein